MIRPTTSTAMKLWYARFATSDHALAAGQYSGLAMFGAPDDPNGSRGSQRLVTARATGSSRARAAAARKTARSPQLLGRPVGNNPTRPRPANSDGVPAHIAASATQLAAARLTCGSTTPLRHSPS